MRIIIALLISMILNACTTTHEFDPTKKIQFKNSVWNPDFRQNRKPLNDGSLVRGLGQGAAWYPKSMGANVLMGLGFLIVMEGLQKRNAAAIAAGTLCGAGGGGLAASANSDLIDAARSHNLHLQKNAGQANSPGYSLSLLKLRW